MHTLYSNFLLKRDPGDDGFDDTHFGGWFYSDEGRTVRYGILLGIIFVFITFIMISYQHAAMRMKKGLAPLPYHRWLISRKRRAEFESGVQQHTQPSHPEDNFSFYQYEHQLHRVPPPAYNPNYVQPPSYPGPPEGATKTAPQQYPPPSYPHNGASGAAPAAGPSSSAEHHS